MNEMISLVFIVVGISFDLFGCLGLIRLPDIYSRLQASTKCVTLGTCGILLGVFIKFGFTAAGVKAIICILFLLLTAPVTAHALAKGAHKSGVRLWKGSVCDKYTEDEKK
ncbi:MAG: monovalent cation/H(+) antiporter subunit G [Candidatus Omnitrophota bacterium]|jgi:multicomponent Na+:H+ antiporter subunit G